MRDWDISVSVVGPEGMPSPEHQGACEFSERGYARLYVLSPEESDPRSVCPFDAEVVLVHELLHPRLAFGAAEETAEWREQERAIEAIARALVALRRKAG